MEPRYIYFHTAKAAIFQVYALVVLVLSLVYAKFALDIPQANVIAGAIFYIVVIVLYSFHLDRKNRGKRGE
jgi:hypothetical protein